jgi:hypothetical protein
VRVSSPKKCLFKFDFLQAHSKGDTSNDFDDDSAVRHVIDLDLNKASRFELQVSEVAGLTIVNGAIEGRAVICGNGDCKNKSYFYVPRLDIHKPASEQPAIARLERAVGFVRQTCPGKPY